MNQTPNAGPHPERIRARIHEGALHRVTRMYTAGLADVFTEALQNSRRAGATRVRVTTHEVSGAQAVAITDDGAGITDPAVLLSFGENGWSEETVRREDAAGMGFLSLARRGCTIASRTRSVAGWRVDLTPAHFLGEEEASILPDEDAPRPHGTAVRFRAEEAREVIRRALENAVRHYPLPVALDGETLPRRDFLGNAVHTEAWRGLAFGVLNSGSRYRDEPDLNFHGLILPVHLPTVHPVDGPAWSVRADVEDCPDLELVLPARKEAVETSFLEEMREAARTAIYRAMAKAYTAPVLAFGEWTRARAAGVELPEPAPALRPWRPPVADIDNWLAGPSPEPLPGDALLMDADLEPPEAQALWRAAERGGTAPRLFEADRRFQGYAWYDALPRVADVRTDVALGGEARPLADFQAPPDRSGPSNEPLPRPEAICMRLDVENPDGTSETIALDADLAFAGEAWAWLADVRPLVTAGSGIEAAELADLLRDAWFSPSDEAGADSWETQRARFEEEALHLAIGLLCSEEEALRRTIACAVRRELFWLIPRDRAVTITVRGGKIGVDFAEGEDVR
ncbi:MAG: sensor histidine kinase [Nitrospinae bacterium]|nr:sensor histidine kinase [Nitrospinota bacterium]